MSKELLRGVIDFEDGALTPEALTSNLNRFKRALQHLVLVNPVDVTLGQAVLDHFGDFGEPPSIRTLGLQFGDFGDVEIQERLKDVQAATVTSRGQFSSLLNQALDQQNRGNLRAALKQAEEICSKGLVLKKGDPPLKGPADAIDFLGGVIHDIIPPQTDGKTRGELRDDVESEWTSYKERKADTSKAYGRLCGLNTIDKTCSGLKRGQLWIHAAYTGEGKTLFALNWCYNLVTKYRTNVLYVSLEMPYDQLQRMIYVIHSANHKWKALGHKPLDLKRVVEGALTPEEEAFYQLVLKDFHENPEHCKFEVWCPDHAVAIADIRGYAQALHRDIEVGLVVVDHSGLTEPPKSRDDYSTRVNSEMRAAKQLALHFDGGVGVPVLLLHQINREGKKAAEKSGGVYGLYHLSQANEAERSADFVTATWLDSQLRGDRKIRFSCLKHRAGPLFETFEADVVWEAGGRIFEDLNPQRSDVDENLIRSLLEV